MVGLPRGLGAWRARGRFGLTPDDEVRSPAGFAAWVDRLRRTPDVRAWCVVEDGVVLGGIALRTGPPEDVERLGHVGYGVRPSARDRGVATWALGAVLPHARAAGLPGLDLLCHDDNVGSNRTIERHGGVLVDPGPVRRYRLDL